MVGKEMQQLPLKLEFERKNSEMSESDQSDFEIPSGTVIYPAKFKSGFIVARSFSAKKIENPTNPRRIYKSTEDVLLIWNKGAKKVIILEGKTFLLKNGSEFYYSRQQQPEEVVASSAS